MEGYGRSWNVQLCSVAKSGTGADEAAIAVAALDESNQVGATVDFSGKLQMWQWPLSDDECDENAPFVLASCATPNRATPLCLLNVPLAKRSLFVAVFSSLVSSILPPDDDVEDAALNAGGELHAYELLDNGTIKHTPLLRTNAGRITAACFNPELLEIVLGAKRSVSTHSFRQKNDTFRMPCRLQIALNVSTDLVHLQVNPDAGTLVGVMRQGFELWVWDASTGAALFTTRPLDEHKFVAEASLHAPTMFFAARLTLSENTKLQTSPLRFPDAYGNVTRICRLDARHAPTEDSLVIEHSGYSPLCTSWMGSVGSLSATLLQLDSDATLRAWTIEEDGAYPVCCARLLPLPKIYVGDAAFIFSAGHKSRLVVVVRDTVAAVVVHSSAHSTDRIVARPSQPCAITALALDSHDARQPVLASHVPAALYCGSRSATLRDLPTSLEYVEALRCAVVGHLGGSVKLYDVDLLDEGALALTCSLLQDARRKVTSTCAVPTVIDGAHETLVMSGHEDGTISVWPVLKRHAAARDLSVGEKSGLPAHAAPIVLLAPLASLPGVCVVSADGEVRVWSLDSTAVGSESTDFRLVGHLDMCRELRRTILSAVVIGPRKHRRLDDATASRHHELCVGTDDGRLELWTLPRTELLFTSAKQPSKSVPQRALASLGYLHSSPINIIVCQPSPASSSYSLPDAYALLTASDDGIVRSLMDADGIVGLERFSLSRRPSALGFCHDNKFWRIVAATGELVSSLAGRTTIFARQRPNLEQLAGRPRTRVLDLQGHFVHIPFFQNSAHDSALQVAELSRAVILGGRTISAMPLHLAQPPSTTPSTKQPPSSGTTVRDALNLSKKTFEVPDDVAVGLIEPSDTKTVFKMSKKLHDCPLAYPGMVDAGAGENFGKTSTRPRGRVAPALPGTSAFKQLVLAEAGMAPDDDAATPLAGQPSNPGPALASASPSASLRAESSIECRLPRLPLVGEALSSKKTLEDADRNSEASLSFGNPAVDEASFSSRAGSASFVRRALPQPKSPHVLRVPEFTRLPVSKNGFNAALSASGSTTSRDWNVELRISSSTTVVSEQPSRHVSLSDYREDYATEAFDFETSLDSTMPSGGEPDEFAQTMQKLVDFSRQEAIKSRGAPRPPFSSDHGTLTVSKSAPAGVRADVVLTGRFTVDEMVEPRPRTQVADHAPRTLFTLGQVLVLPLNGGYDDEVLPQQAEAYGLQNIKRRRRLMKRRLEAHTPAIPETDEYAECVRLLHEHRRSKRDAMKKEVRGVRGFGFGTEWPRDDVEDELTERLKRLLDKAHLADALRTRRMGARGDEYEEDAEDAYERWLRLQRTQSEGDDAEARKLAGMTPGMRELERIFNSLRADQTRRVDVVLLAWPRVASWKALATAFDAEVIDRVQAKELWRKAHRNAYTGDRGDLSDFICFVRLVDEFVTRKRLASTLELRINDVGHDSVQLDVLCGELSKKQGSEISPELALARDPDAADLVPEHVEVHIVAFLVTGPTLTKAPTHTDALGHTGASSAVQRCVLLAPCSVPLTLRGLEPETAYALYATAVRVAPSELVHPRPRRFCGTREAAFFDEQPNQTPELGRDAELLGRFREDADKIVESTRLQVRTLLGAGMAAATGRLPESRGEIEIDWDSLSPQMQKAELFAALKDKTVCKILKELGMEKPSEHDAKLSVQEKDPDAKKRWEAFCEWWPTSEEARREFGRREMTFAAKNDDILEAAAAEGFVLHAGDVQAAMQAQATGIATPEDEEKLERWRDFQKWYCGVPTEEPEPQAEPQAEPPEMTLVPGENKKHAPKGAPVEATPAAAATRPKTPKSGRANKTPKRTRVDKTAAVSQIVDDASVDSTIAVRVADAAPAAKGTPKVSPKLPNAAAIARLQARTTFLAGRTNKIAELRSAVEKINEGESKKRRKAGLKSYVKVIMFQLRLMKSLSEPREIKLQQEDEELDIFGDHDESAILTRAVMVDIEGGDGQPRQSIEPPLWSEMTATMRQNELAIATHDNDVIDFAIEARIVLPDVEDYVIATAVDADESRLQSELRKRAQARLKAYEEWYPTVQQARVCFWTKEADAAVKDEALKAHAVSARITDPYAFQVWYSKSREMREDFLKRSAARLLMLRRAAVGARGLLSEPHVMFRSMPPLAYLAAEPPPPRRYKLYPSRMAEAWSVKEILRWFPDEELNQDRDFLRDLNQRLVAAWKKDEWLRTEMKRREETQRGMLGEDERASRLRLSELEILEAERHIMSSVQSRDGKAAKDVVDDVRRRKQEAAEIAALHDADALQVAAIFYHDGGGVPAPAPAPEASPVDDFIGEEGDVPGGADSGSFVESHVSYVAIDYKAPAELVFGTAMGDDFESRVAEKLYVNGTGLDNDDEKEDEAEGIRLAREGVEQLAAEEKRKRDEERRKREEEEARKKSEEDRQKRVRQNAEERLRIEAHFAEVHRQRVESDCISAAAAAQAALDAEEALRRDAIAADRVARDAMDYLELLEGQSDEPSFSEEDVACHDVPDAETSHVDLEQLASDEERRRQLELLDVIYTPHQQMFGDDYDDPRYIARLERRNKPRSVDRRMLSSAEAILLDSPKPQRFVTSRATREFDRMLQLPREPLRETREPLDTDALVEALRLNRSVLEASLDEMPRLVSEAPRAVPLKRLLMQSPLPFKDVSLGSEAVPLFPRQHSNIELAVKGSRDRISRLSQSSHSAPFAKRGGPHIIGTNMTINKAFSKPKKTVELPVKSQPSEST